MTSFKPAWRTEVIGDAAALAAIAPAWAALFSATALHRPSPALCHGYVSLGLRHLARDTTPCIITIWQHDRLVLAWPLSVRHAGVLRVARHIGCGSDEEYAGPLVAGDVDLSAVLALAMRRLRAAADMVWLFNLKDGTPVTNALATAGLRRARQPIASPIVHCGGHADMAAWRQTRSRNFRMVLGRDRRQLARLGQLESVRVQPEQADRFADWFFATKCQWLDGRGIGDNWLRRPQSRAFFSAALADPGGTGVFATALMLDGHVIAGNLCLDSDPIEFLATTYDTAYAKYGPGSLAYEDVIADGVATGRDVDLRITNEGYKQRWADASEARTTLLLALTPRGLLPVLGFALRLYSKALRRRLGALRRRWRR